MRTQPLLRLVLIVLLSAGAHLANAADWPTYRHDQHRSGVTDETIDVLNFNPAWSWQSALPPAPAWPDSARWDAYAKLDGLRSMRDYDPVFHTVVQGDNLIFASNADDTVRCLSLETGKVKWKFTVDAPVRVAPAIHADRVYFSADDGRAYAVDLSDGKLVWARQVSSEAKTFINDGRLCSFQPVRTGTLLDLENDKLIVACGIFPWQSALLVALELKSGEIAWEQDLGTGWTLEGPMLLSENAVIAPQGRSPPQLFSRNDGKPLGSLSGGGGSFVLLTEDEQLLHGPGNKAGWITSSSAATREKVASFEGGTAVVVSDNVSYLLSPTGVSAVARTSGQVLWRSAIQCPHEIILAGNTLITGGDDCVAALDSATGDLLWAGEVEGRAIGLAVASERLIVSTDKGQIRVFDNASTTASRGPLPEDLVARLGFEAQDPGGPIDASGTAVRPEDVASEGLLQQWYFHQDLADCDITDVSASSSESAAPSTCTLSPSAPGGRELNLPGGSRFVQVGQQHALLLDDTTDCEVVDDFKKLPLPTQELTAITTVRIDRGQPWGGLLSVAQDNGSYEKGWILGFRGQNFGFALNASQGPDHLSWTLAKEAFEPGRWYHVAATYDGKATRLFVNGKLAGESTEQAGNINYPETAAFHLGSYKDSDEHFYSLGQLNEVALFERSLSADEIATRYQERREALGQEAFEASLAEPQTHEQLAELRDTQGDWRPATGPEVRFTGQAAASVTWTTEQEMACKIEIVSGNALAQTEHSAASGRVHHWSLSGVDRNELITFRIADADGQTTGIYECDGHFDYTRPALPANDSLVAYATAKELVDALQLAPSRGIALVLGAGDAGAFAEGFSSASNLDVIALETDEGEVQRGREHLLASGMYGRPVSLLGADALAGMPGQIANVIVLPTVAQRTWRDYASLERVTQRLKPGGQLVVPQGTIQPAQAVQLGLMPDRVTLDWQGLNETSGQVDVWTGARDAGAAGWTHMYGSADNTAYAGETLQEADSIDDMQLAWCGRPGPRYQSDRGNRKPSPLAAGGRLYLQGLHRLISLDAHNGTILWSHELPELERFNIPRDCSNWCADENSVYLAMGNRCKLIDGASGSITADYPVWNPTQRPMHWGFIARHDDLLVGSCVQAGAHFTEFWGGENWYDSKDGEHAKKVSSDGLFALDAQSGAMVWNYQGGLIINPTLSIADGQAVFLECRSPSLIDGPSRRLDGDELWQHLFIVAIDIATGQKNWETEARPLPGVSAVYGVLAGGKFLLQTSDAGQFALYAIDAKSGESLWRGKYAWEADHHGKHLSRPAVVDNKIYLRPLTLALESGEVLAKQFPVGHQCGTYTASKNALFLRAGSLTMWDRQSSAASRWNRVRPDCWISTIPAEGMLLSPEGGGGCSCGGWIETSMGFAPLRGK